MALSFDSEALRTLIREVLEEVVDMIGWPAGRIALDEAEAAAACGVARHVLRDLRLAGRIKGRKLGRKVVYTRQDLLRAFDAISEQADRETEA
jgi:hypothetical protein